MSNEDVTTPGTRLRCSWEVTGGIIPRQPILEYSRRWLLTSEVFYAEQEAGHADTFIRFKIEAHDYARDLTDPGILNWVSIEWIYL